MNIHDVYRPFLRFFRTRRMALFVRLFALTDADRIVDMGGSPFNWGLISQHPHITLVNITGPDWERDRMRMLTYDGRHAPFPDNSFDICYSNSVIEHVGGAEEMRIFAGEIRRLAPAYYVQTPNLWFFVEPHFLSVFLHWLPNRIKRRLFRYFSIWGLVTKPSLEHIDRTISDINLLTVADMRELFPDAKILRERFLGMTKSIIAVRIPKR